MFEEDQRFLVADGAFKHQDYNALFIAKKHNPLTLDLEDYKALFKTANKWFEAVIKGINQGLLSQVGQFHDLGEQAII